MMSWVRRRWTALRAEGTQRGQASSVSMVIWLPTAFFLLFAATAYNTWSYAHELAQGAAEIAAEDAGLAPASADRGQTAATDFLVRRGPQAISDVQVSITVDGNGNMVATVTGEARGMFGVLVPRVTATAARAAEPTP